jgi:hypothetical protein
MQTDQLLDAVRRVQCRLVFKDLVDKGKCALGFHAGEWTYSARDRCDQVRICTRCKHDSRQVVHIWQDWRRLEDGQCVFARPCSRCALSEKKTEHSWGEAVYPDEGSCAMVQPCAGCTNTKPAGTVHIWNAWTYDAPDTCNQKNCCSRCRAEGTVKRVAHDWNPWRNSEFYETRVQVCRRCAEMVFDLEGEGAVVSMQAAARSVNEAIVAAQTGALRSSIEKNRSVILSPVAIKYLAYAEDQLSQSADVREAHADFAAVLNRCNSEGLDAVFGPSPAAAASVAASATRPAATPLQAAAVGGAALDASLFGHWRHTEPVSGCPTDTHCMLDNAGRFKWWSKSVSQFGVRDSDPEYGTWHVAGGLLHLLFEDGTHLELVYITDQSSMVWRNHGRYRLWTRLN